MKNYKSIESLMVDYKVIIDTLDTMEAFYKCYDVSGYDIRKHYYGAVNRLIDLKLQMRDCAIFKFCSIPNIDTKSEVFI